MTEPKSSPPPPAGKGGVVVPHEPSLLQRTGARLIHLLISAIALTIRFRFTETAGLGEKLKGPVIYCTWHNRLALCIPIYWRFAHRKNPTRGMAAMASASKDGAFLAAIIRSLGVHAARGSSSRRGPRAMLELTHWAEQGYDLAITPDGPRGPKYKLQSGAISLAQVTGLPILPASYNLQWKIQVKSWDGFQIPLPFSRCDATVAGPIFVAREASEADREKIRQQVESTLLALTKD